MKVGILSYPMLFQAQGGLQIQITETIRALNDLGCEARLMDCVRDRLTDFDICHVFSVINGNFRMIEYCRARNVPVVLSPLLQPHWTKSLSFRANLSARLNGRMTNWNVKTEFQEIQVALAQADLLVALGEREKKCIQSAFGIDSSHVEVVRNGIPLRFFEGDERIFLREYQLDPGFVLCVASISAYKNQLTLARAVSAAGLRLVLIGPCQDSSRTYLEQVLAEPGARYIGPLPYEDPRLASAYAAAGIFCLPSLSEVMPLSVLESLAAGTPVVLTENHAMDTEPLADCLIEVSPGSVDAIKTAITRILASPPSPSHCRNSVAGMTWKSVATRLVDCYRRVIADPQNIRGIESREASTSLDQRKTNLKKLS